MAKRTRPTPADFTLSQLKNMLAAKERMVVLESQRATLEKDLGRIEKELAKLTAGKAGRLGKKIVRKKAAKKKVAKKRVAEKAPAKRSTKTSPAKRRPTVESVVVDLLKANGEPMAFKDILATIEKKKLVKTKSKNFANVLRRTLSTSKAIKRAGRGVYGA